MTLLAAIDRARAVLKNLSVGDMPPVAPAIKPRRRAAIKADCAAVPALLVVQGLAVCIDRPAGFVQTKLDDAGAVLWTREYTTPYGYLDDTAGGDGDELDVFVGPALDADAAWWFSICDQTGGFDEYNVVLCAESADAARAIILAHIPPQFVMPGCAMTTIGQIKALLGVDPAAASVALEQMSKALTPRIDVSLLSSVTKAGELRYIFGIVLEPEVVDGQGEIYSAEEIRKTAWLWMSEFRNIDLQHRMYINDLVDPVESYTAPVDFDVAADGTFCQAGQGVRRVLQGTWLIGAIVNDDALWADVKSGKFTGWSINGFSKKQPA